MGTAESKPKPGEEEEGFDSDKLEPMVSERDQPDTALPVCEQHRYVWVE